jgi:alpha/beta superfamily hydrolase
VHCDVADGFPECICSYRGYGRSQGQPNEEGIKLDAQAALDYLLSREDVNRGLVNDSEFLCLLALLN